MHPQVQGIGAGQQAVQVGDLIVNPSAHEVRRCGQLLQLTRLEFRLLHVLARCAGQVVPYGDLISGALGYTSIPSEEAGSTLLKTHISHLRTKVARPSGGGLTIKSVLGVGYLLSRV